MAKVWKVPALGMKTASLPLPKHQYVPRVFYTLYRFDSFEHKHIKVSENVYASEKLAFSIYKDRIKEAPLTMSIRPVRVKSDKAGHFTGVSYNEFRDSPLRSKTRGD